MKSANLKKLMEHGFRVPAFIEVKNPAEVKLDFSKQDLFAVRSSFEGEDGTEFSFAGQFETLLNVSRSQVPEAIKAVQASYQAPEVQAYRSAHQIRKGESGKVIVQEMVQAKWSGVLFTANPQGIMNEMVLVVGEGLGANVVEDKVPVTTYYFHIEDEVFYYETQDNSPLLEDEVLHEIIQNGKRIEELFQQKMDIEFAIQNKKIFILQARPITALNQEAEKIILDNSNIVESYPGVSLPATQDFVREVYYRVFRSCLLRLTRTPELVKERDSYLKNMVDVANGRIYYRISNWYDVLLLLPFSHKIIPIWQQMLGVSHQEVTQIRHEKISKRIKLKILYTFFDLLQTNPKKMAELNDYFEAIMPLYSKRLEESQQVSQLIALFNEMMEDLGSKWDITLVNDLYAFIFTAMTQKKAPGSLQDIQKLESLKPIKHLDELIQVAREKGIDSQAYSTAKEAYITCYGDRCLEELKLETCSLRTAPEQLDSYVASALAYQKGTHVKKLKVEESVPKQQKREAWYVRKAKVGIRNREISRLNRSRLFGIARSILLKIGAIYVKEGIIEVAEDIFYLHMEEILQGQKAPICMKDTISKRKDQYQMYKQLPSYSRLVFSGKVIQKSHLNVNNRCYVKGEDILQGTPCSDGIVLGEVLVVHEPTVNLETRDKILVTQMTDPGWVFLIKEAKGIIAEKGSLLSHTAIVTRELKKPSVVGVKNATRLLKTGDYIRLDGVTGKIEIIQEAALGEEISYEMHNL